MSVLTIQLPESLQKNVVELARREGISVDQFVASAVGEKMASLMTLEYLRGEAREGKREEFERFLAAVPDREPDEGDGMLPGYKTWSVP